jgi:hypothetical protein
VIDLQAYGALPQTNRSIAVDVSRSSAWVTGSAGDLHFNQTSIAWAWHLAGATSTGGQLTAIPSVNLHSLIGNPPPFTLDTSIAGVRSLGMAVRHETSAATPVFVGGFTYACAQINAWKGFRLVYGDVPDTYQLWGMVNGGFKATARDITVHPQGTGLDPTMVVGGVFGCGGASEDPCLFPSLCDQDCFSSHRFGTVWRAPWDDNDEDPNWTPAELLSLRDRADEVLPPLETMFGPTGSDGFRASVHVNRANAVGELVGVGVRDSTDSDPPRPGTCRHRVGFWWNEPSEENPIGWNAWDLDTEYGGTPQGEGSFSRAFGLSERSASRPVLLVGGEDDTEAKARAVCWCGYAEEWERSFVGFTGNDPTAIPRVRWDDLDVLGTMDAQYGLDLVNWQVESVHDLNRLGQMVVLLRGNASATEGHIYPAIVTLSSDISADFTVSGFDLAVLIADWGPVPTATVSTQSDLDGDGQVGASDLALLLGEWGAITDLHTYFCSSGLLAQSGESASTAGGSAPSGESVEFALVALGFTDIQQLQAWTQGASEAQLQGLGEMILVLSATEPNQ